jgi:carboxymethylenebutenolidase
MPAEAGHLRLADGTAVYWAPSPAPTDTGLVLLPSMAGFTAGMEGWCRALAAEQRWVVCAPEVICEDRGLDMSARAACMPSVRDDEVLAALTAAADATSCATVNLIGFCVGGMFALKAASLGRFARIVAFYGMVRLPDDWKVPGQAEPLDLVRSGADRVLGIFGEHDEFVPVDHVATLRATGAAVVTYPDAGHAFAHDVTHPNYRPYDAADAWRRAIHFLRETR